MDRKRLAAACLVAVSCGPVAAEPPQPKSASLGDAITSVADLPAQMVVLDRRVEELSKRVDELSKSVAAVNQTLAPVGALAKPEGLKPAVEAVLDAAFAKAVALLLVATACGAGLMILSRLTSKIGGPPRG